jgi:hypothetical protein
MKTISLSIVALILSGCASHSTNVKIGTDQSYVSLSDQRQALKSVSEYEAIPAGAKVLGRLDAGRCHRRQGEIEPSEDLVKVDLKVAAFARGADGISNIVFNKAMALSGNCWYILTGEATMFSIPK